MAISGLISTDILIPALMNKVDELLQIYGQQAYEALSHYLLMPATILATLYVAIQGIQLLLGQVELSMAVFIKTSLRIGIIFTLLGSGGWAYVSRYSYELFNALSLKLGNALLKLNTATPAENLFDELQGLLNQFSKIGFNFFAQGHLTNPLPYLNGLIVWFVGFVLTAMGLFEIIVAKVMFALLIVILPLILLACFFKIFQPIFDRWLGFVLGAFLLQILIYVVLAFDLTLSDWWLSGFKLSVTDYLSNLSAISIVILGVISIGLMSKMSNLAYGMGSGVSSLSERSGVGHWIARSLWGRSHHDA